MASDFEAAQKRLTNLADTSPLVNEVTPIEDIRLLLVEVERLKAEVRDQTGHWQHCLEPTYKAERDKARRDLDRKDHDCANLKERAEKAEAGLAAERACHDCREYRAMVDAQIAAERETNASLERDNAEMSRLWETDWETERGRAERLEKALRGTSVGLIAETDAPPEEQPDLHPYESMRPGAIAPEKWVCARCGQPEAAHRPKEKP